MYSEYGNSNFPICLVLSNFEKLKNRFICSNNFYRDFKLFLYQSSFITSTKCLFSTILLESTLFIELSFNFFHLFLNYILTKLNIFVLCCVMIDCDHVERPHDFFIKKKKIIKDIL